MAYPEWVERQRRPGTNINCIRGKYYLYEVTSVWNKEKGRAQKKTGKYLGRITEEGLIPPKPKKTEVEVNCPTICEWNHSNTVFLLIDKRKDVLDSLKQAKAYLFIHSIAVIA